MRTNLQEDEDRITRDYEETEGLIAALLTKLDPPQVQEINITEGGNMAFRHGVPDLYV